MKKTNKAKEIEKAKALLQKNLEKIFEDEIQKLMNFYVKEEK